MPKLPALALIVGLACAVQPAAGQADESRIANAAPASAAPAPAPGFAPSHATPNLASLAVAVGEVDGFPAASVPAPSAPPSARATARDPAPDGSPDFWGLPGGRAQTARAEDAAPPAPGLLIDASTGQGPDGGPSHQRLPGAYAPYQANPPILEQKLDAAALLSSLQARGFTDVSHLKLRGSAYVCEATGPRRERVRLVVDAASGAIFGVEVIGYDSRRN
ncbi:hypothetical protein [Azorhizobium sp. AG788]|uniref:hypothetical protein n=1 Tax=Azorhizobium sp. AG788 TaxID=2183897 RepID=UPI00313A1A00